MNNEIYLTVEMPFQAMIDKLLDVSWADEPCIRIMARQCESGDWTCTEVMSSDEARKYIDEEIGDSLDEMDYFIMAVDLDDIRVSGFKSDDMGAIELFGDPQDCVEFAGKLIYEEGE